MNPEPPKGPFVPSPLSLGYSHTSINRRAEVRGDRVRIGEAFSSVHARIIPVWRGQNLLAVEAQEGPKAGFVVHADRLALNLSLTLADLVHPWVYLGEDAVGPLFAIDLSECPRPEIDPWAGAGQFVDLRHYAPFLAANEANLLAYARGMFYWHRHHRFCGSCGTATRIDASGHIRVCQNPACGKQTFPRTDPAVIMLVEECLSSTSEPRCLMGRHSRWPRGVYSTLAGFVEPGESLEQAVAREVYEEAGIEVEQVQYLASQPWPFPASLMIGFQAQALGLQVVVDADELEDARWFTIDEILNAGEWSDETAELRLPRRDSIARFLIQTWINRRHH